MAHPRITAPTKALGRLLTLREAAELLNLSVRSLHRMITRRELAVIRLGHGRGVLRVTQAELERVIAAGTHRGWLA